MSQKEQSDILWMDEVNIFDKNIVGGKNASLGEMYSNLVSKDNLIQTKSDAKASGKEVQLEYWKENY